MTPATPTSSDDVQLYAVQHALRRRWRIVVATVVIITGAVAAVAFNRPATYTSDATVLLRPLAGNALDSDSATNSQQVTIAMETEAGLITSPEVTSLVNRRTGLHASAGSPKVSATVPANTETVHISFTSSSPIKAREGAQAYADGFLKFRSDRAENTNHGQLTQLRRQSDDAEKSLKTASKAAKAKDAPAAASAKVHLYANRVSSLEDQISQIKVASSDPGFVVTPASTPTRPDGIAPWMFTLAAGLLSLLLGGAIATWRERSSDVMRSDVDVTVGGVPVLAVVPPTRLETPDKADAVTKDAYRRARVSTLAHVDRGTILAVCDVPGTSAAAEMTTHLGIALAEAGHRVSLVDASSDDRELSKMFGKEREPGLSEALAARGEGPPSVTKVFGMQFLPAGKMAGDVRDLLGGEEFKLVLGHLRAKSDIVLMVAPPTSAPENDAISLCADGLILAIADGHTTHAQIVEIQVRKSWLGVGIVGCICGPRRRSPRHRTRASRSQRRSSATNRNHADTSVVEQQTMATNR